MMPATIVDGLAARLCGERPGPRRAATGPLPGSAEALLAWSLQRATGRTVVIVTDGRQSLESRHQDLLTLTPLPVADAANGPRVLFLPARETLVDAEAEPDPEIAGWRLGTLLDLLPGRAAAAPRIIVTCVQALMQRTVEPALLAADTLVVSLGMQADPQELAHRLEACGYGFEPEVAEKGKAALKGGLLDVWPLTSAWPLRIEFFGRDVESIRSFDPESQRSVARLDRAMIAPASESWGADAGRRRQADLLQYLPAPLLILWSDAESIRHHAGLHEELMREAGDAQSGLAFEELQTLVEGRRDVDQVVVDADPAAGLPPLPVDFEPLPALFSVPRDTLQPDPLDEARHRLLDALRQRAAAGQSVQVYFDTQGAKDHFEAERGAGGEGGKGGLAVHVGALSGGFVSESLGLAVVAECDVYGRRKQQDRRYEPAADRARPARPAGLRVADLTDVEPGDLVVHVEHGIGRYEGLTEITFDERRQEVLTIEYADGARLHVPVAHAHLLSRYVGVSKHHVQLHRLGGKRWERDKAAAERAIRDMASSLLETQAQRRLLDGFAFQPDTPWQHEFEAAFPHRETPDQLTVLRDVKRDMESSRPMDRLVCGDAGYGKTEVAMRAIFKAVMNAKQVALLVPTTVLAQQHYQTFRERMAAYPVRVEMLSRFCSRARQEEALRGLAAGAVDIVIGTHALLQPGVQFKDLGLVVIDEEQRFGVAHKEKLKQLRRLVDVMTLTATPIPRTLHMSLTGARDMSLLQTPPRERMAIETIATRATDKVIREAILRELNREGQVFYLHNRIMTIERVRARLEELVPEARVRIGHGQMSAAELSGVMRDFVAGEFDVLLCTTIIESGMDIPRANTILIDRADRFGIADLYQLRGRVGRSNRKAYAYLLLPAYGPIDADARKRIGAVKKYSSLSAGFSLALRDLEIRGAGNMLGAEQSGHISAVGFGLYCQLLQRTVAQLKGEPVPPVIDVDLRLDFIDLSPAARSPENSAFIPYEYIEDERVRLGAYRRLAETATLADVRAVREDFADRYGPLPGPLARLLDVAELRIVCAEQEIRKVETRDDKLMLTGEGGYLMEGHHFPRLQGRSADDKLRDALRLVRSCRRWSRPAAGG